MIVCPGDKTLSRGPDRENEGSPFDSEDTRIKSREYSVSHP